eukprot:GHVL01032779.1.p1 GENE.GHVL01032779.1~~GHVL01032779.1.p1  ORF type:complete len:121 (-),score=26.55 GHVL01032779.1:468-830(-)
MQEAKAKAESQQHMQQQQLEKAAQQQEQKQQYEEQRRIMLRTVLEPEASERLHRINLVKPEKGRQVEDFILEQASRGAMQRIDNDTLVSILERISNIQQTKKSIVTIRKRCDDSDDDLGI